MTAQIRGLQIELELQATYIKAKKLLKGLRKLSSVVNDAEINSIQQSMELFTKEYEALDEQRYALSELIDNIEGLVIKGNALLPPKDY